MRFSLYLGPYQPFLEEELYARVRELRSADPFSPLVVLVPNRLLVRHLREELARKQQWVFNIRFLTFHQYLLESMEDKWMTEGFRVLPETLVPWFLKEKSKAGRKTKGPFSAVENTPGFYKALRATLSELKQGDFNPTSLGESAVKLSKAKDRQSLSAKLREFSLLLESYEAWKKKEKWKDLDDLYAGALELPPSPTPLWVYGFYDASVLQQKALKHLCSAQNSDWFIPYEDNPVFDYAKPFVEWAGRLGEVIKPATWKRDDSSPLKKLQGNIFITEVVRWPEGPSTLGPNFGTRATSMSQSSSYSDEAPRNDNTFENSDVKILLCPGEPREIREGIRTLLDEAEKQEIPFSRCAVVLRQMENYRRMLGQAFSAQGVPLAKEPTVFLMETPEGKAVQLLLQCFQQEFPRDLFLNFLSSPNLKPEGFGLGPDDWNPHLWDRVSKEAGVVEGEKAWLDRLNSHLASRSRVSVPEEEELSKEEGESIRDFRKVLQKLFTTRQTFNLEKSWEGKSRVLLSLVMVLFRVSRAQGQLAAVLKGIQSLSRLSLGVSPEDFTSVLSELLEEQMVPWEKSDPGGVEVLDLMQARGVPFDVMVLPGLVEQGFPRVVRQDPLLLDEERRILNGLVDAKARIPEKAEGRLEEKLLFALAVRGARKTLVLTAPDLDPSTGGPRIPSIYLYETAQAVTGKRQAHLAEAGPFVKKIQVSGWIRGEGDRCGDDLEQLLSRFQMARGGKPLPALAYVAEKPFYFKAQELLKNRQWVRAFTPYDGVFQSPQALAELQKSHSLQGKALSASRLETYASCPIRYFFKYILKLKIHPEPERIFQLEAADKGTLMHAILEETLARGLTEGWFNKRETGKGRKVLVEETQKAFDRFEKDGLPGSPALWAWSRFSMTRDLERAFLSVMEDLEWVPGDFEKDFGKKDQAEVLFPASQGNFRLEGWMDRVDFSADGKRLRVLDYKTGSSTSFKKNSVKEGAKLQMPLYLWACRILYPGVVPESAVFDFLTAKGGYRRVSYDAGDWKKVEEPLRTVLETASEAVSQGLFPAAAKNCGQCDYQALCGTGRERRGERKKEDPRVKGYYRLEELT